MEGEILADGDWIQTTRDDRVTDHLLFRFKDGSTHEETAVFSQRRNFRLLNAHVAQKGPEFPHPIEMTIDASRRQVTVRYTEDGREESTTEHLDLPSDLANGMVLTLLKNLPTDLSPKRLWWWPRRSHELGSSRLPPRARSVSQPAALLAKLSDTASR